MTVAWFIKPNDTNGPEMIAYNTTGGNLKFDAYFLSNHIEVRINDGAGSDTVVGASIIPQGRWSHVLFRKNGTGAGALQLFINGKLDGTLTSNRSIQALTEALYFGTRSNNEAASAVNGLMAEVGIWEAGLTDQEIMLLSMGINPAQIRLNRLKGYWPLDDYGVSGIARDKSIYNNTANMTGVVLLRTTDTLVEYSPWDVITDLEGFSISTETLDADTVYVNIQVSSVEFEESVEAATIPIDLQTSGVEGVERTDAAIVYVDLQTSGIDEYSPLVPWWDPIPDSTRKWLEITERKWPIETSTRFRVTVRGRI